MSSSREPVVRNGWTLLVWRDFAPKLAELERLARRLREADPEGARHHPQVRFFAQLLHLIHHAIPADPAGPQFLQGNTLGPQHRAWRRAKFAQRYRLFFRFHSPSKTIVYVWLNDERTLRNAGARSDPYAVFRHMLESRRPPTDFSELLGESDPLPGPPEV
jgi:toxin YhaV